jgi:hypothetical protein
MARAPLIFVGFPVDERIERALAGCREADRLFLEDPAYLEQAVIDGRRYIGRSLGDQAGLDRVDDTVRNVASLLGRVSPDLRLTAADARVLSGEGDGAGTSGDDEGDPEL